MTSIRKHIDIVEHAIARKGDWEYDPGLIGAVTQFIYNQNWHKVGTIAISGDRGEHVYDVARHNNAPHYVVGNMQPVVDKGRDNVRAGKEEFGMVLHLQMSAVANLHFRDKGNVLGYPNLHVVNGIAVKQEERGIGLARKMYVWLVANNVMILGDREQYFGARRLWARLSEQTDVVVDIIDYDPETVIDRNVTLHHGQYDADFDQRVWSYGEDKQAIRLVLRAIS